ncbi:hypothetical protein NEHOM01_1870 [Nematocida homosporus]|uniref:uncharacterized protein n=1 Tax=Nematocida homosporus TaxID=1912981 RepID=UPI00221F7DE9|nr:uncharacterized protein NEHOM01_1870 [Nematocida homosporus]KAI5187018.1 hypothetical protein NEHOM01_1870 [Nematocida homosporus]
MKVLSIDLGSFKAVMASSDTSAGEIVLNEPGSRDTKMSIDYRGKKRSFGLVGASYRNREKVAEEIRNEIEIYCTEYLAGYQKKKHTQNVSHIYGLISYLIKNYLKKQNLTAKDIELELVVPSDYTEAHKTILTKLVGQLGTPVSCISDSQALCAYYLSRRTPAQSKYIIIADLGHSTTTVTLALISSEILRIRTRVNLAFGGRDVTNALATKIYNEQQKQSISDIFTLEEFKTRNAKQLNWIKNALTGLPEVKTQMDISNDQTIEIKISRQDLEQLIGQQIVALRTLLKEVYAKAEQDIDELVATATEDNPVERPSIEVEVTGGSSRLFFVPTIVEAATSLKAQVQLNADESAALGGVYRMLMESVHHRFRFDPVITDIIDVPYILKVEHASVAPRQLTIIPSGYEITRERKAKLVSAKYDSSVQIISPAKKLIKLKNVLPDSSLTISVGNYPIYTLSPLTESPAESEPKVDTKAKATTPGAKNVSFRAWIEPSGFLGFSSADLVAQPVIDQIDLSHTTKHEANFVAAELEATAVEDRTNSAQARLFESFNALSEGDLAQIPSAAQLTEELWLHSQSIPTNLTTIKDIEAWEQSIEDSLKSVVEPEWNALAATLADKVAKDLSWTVKPPKYPGIFALYSIESTLRDTATQEIQAEEARQEQLRQAEEARKEEEMRKQEEQQPHEAENEDKAAQ